MWVICPLWPVISSRPLHRADLTLGSRNGHLAPILPGTRGRLSGLWDLGPIAVAEREVLLPGCRGRRGRGQTLVRVVGCQADLEGRQPCIVPSRNSRLAIMPLGLGPPFVAESGVVTDTVRPHCRVVAVGRGRGTCRGNYSLFTCSQGRVASGDRSYRGGACMSGSLLPSPKGRRPNSSLRPSPWMFP